MNSARWSQVDDYLSDVLLSPDPVLQAALRTNAQFGLPAYDVTPLQGMLLHLLARIQGAARILEIGTLGGYSTIWLARALPPGGRLISLELEPKHAEVARTNIARAKLSDQVEVRVGQAEDLLRVMAEEGQPPFDLIFIDADKENTDQYFSWSCKLARPGSLIVMDNVVREGSVADPDSEDRSVQGIRRFFESVAATPNIVTTVIQTVGSKGYDGFALVVVTEDAVGTRARDAASCPTHED
jgi:predicted O-methyltransferase YrrM